MDIRLKKRRISSDGTVKYLFSLTDGSLIETVVMRYSRGLSVCISTQVGCRMRCSFCASAEGGFVRNLSASEMLLQVYLAERRAKERIGAVTLMGIGEPLDNFCNVMSFYDIITDKAGHGLSNRAVSISTCGVPGRIAELADMKKQLTLSVSLHAPTDEKRNRLMPVNRKYPISQLIDDCRYYIKKTGRRVTFEYTVIGGVNDGREDARLLAELLKGINCHVNLIAVNPLLGRDFNAAAGDVRRFFEELKALSVGVTVRRRLGTDIYAACGQLRSAEEKGDSVV